jgi:molecular chaperone GrpE
MNKQNEQNEQLELTQDERKLLESRFTDQLVLEHPSYKELEDKLTQAEQKSQENWDGFLRTKAELDNVQRRAEREISNAHKYALDKFASEILVIVDNLERSVEAKTTDHGIELTLKLFLEVLQKFGIIQVENPVGKAFDPQQHMAVMTKEDANFGVNIVLEVVQKGYWLKDRLLRPALVVVAK